MRLDASVVTCALAVAGLTSTAAFASSVHATVASDGRFAIYTGTAEGTDLDFIATNEYASASTNGLTPFTRYFELDDQRYIYVAVWGNTSPETGLLAEFLFNGIAVLSGDPAWQAYATPVRSDVGAAPPSPAEMGQHIRTATRRFAWEKAAVFGANGYGPAGNVASLNSDAAWMWTPTQSAGVATTPVGDGQVVIFRISPTELWPEIELWHDRNVGAGPLSGGNSRFDARYHPPGGGGGGGGAYGLGNYGTGAVRGPRAPFASYDPPGSATTPATNPPATHTNSSVTERPDAPPEEEPTRPLPPIVPEPSTGLLLLVGTLCLRPRR